MKILIIGNGIAGTTAARHIRKLSDDEITIISPESKYFFSRTALMYVYMGHMRFEDTKPYEDWFWEKNNISLVQDTVSQINSEAKTINLDTGVTMEFDKLIIATGSIPNKFGWPGQDLDGVGKLYHYQDLEYMEKYSQGLKRAVIVGGGLIGLEMAEMFRSRQIDVTMLVREEHYWNNVMPEVEAKIIGKHIIDHHIDLRLEDELVEILADEKGAVKSVITKSGIEIPCGYVGLTAGVRPNVAWIDKESINIERGIVVDGFLETNVKDIFAIGDCAQMNNPKPGRRSIEAVWYTGRIMGETVAQTICGNPTEYDPGIWFNSAKFLDIEYQVYGDMPPRPPEGISTFIWKKPEKNISIRINYNKESEVTGFNFLGVRFRHEVCEKWIKDKTQINEVISNLSLGNFDPEFYKEYNHEIQDLWYNLTGYSSINKTKRKWNNVFHFLKNK